MGKLGSRPTYSAMIGLHPSLAPAALGMDLLVLPLYAGRNLYNHNGQHAEQAKKKQHLAGCGFSLSVIIC